MTDPAPVIALGIVTGTFARWYLLRVDYRMYPSYPQGYLIHMAFGAIAASLGAVAIPAIVAKDYQAATFLALAATQFREVRKIERETLSAMEATELVRRGAAYIEGIARVFEARNYLAMLTALITYLVALAVPVPLHWRLIVGGAAGITVPLVLRGALQGPRVGDVAHVRVVELAFEGPLLVVDGVTIMNIGLSRARQTYLENGLGVVITPKDPNAKATLANVGQRQAIAHDAAGQLGIRRDVDEPEFSPLVRLDSVTGKVVMSIVPAERNPEALETAVRNVPVLEATWRRPLASQAGRMAD